MLRFSVVVFTKYSCIVLFRDSSSRLFFLVIYLLMNRFCARYNTICGLCKIHFFTPFNSNRCCLFMNIFILKKLNFDVYSKLFQMFINKIDQILIELIRSY